MYRTSTFQSSSLFEQSSASMGEHMSTSVPVTAEAEFDAGAGLPPTSLVICSRNRPKLLRETVQSVLEGDEVPTEIVIVDQSDAPQPVLSSRPQECASDVRYLWLDSVGLSRARNAGIAAATSVGLSRARNAGIAAATYDILVFIDDDMFVTPNWFGTLIRTLVQGGKRAAVSGRVLPTAPESSGGFAIAMVVGEEPAIYEGRIGTDVLAGGHMAMYRSAFGELGGFDERLGAGSLLAGAEDNEFGFRLLEAGYRIVYEPRAVLYHRAWRTNFQYVRIRWNYGRGKGGFYSKYLSLRDRYMLRRMLWDIAYRIVGFPRRVWRDPRLALGDIPYIVGILSGSTQWFLTYRRPK
jgi:GT2 family glycosyltransferase